MNIGLGLRISRSTLNSSPSSSFNPLALAPEVWLHAPSLTGLVNDDRVDSFTDLSGNNHHAIGAGDARAYYAASGINGKPTVYSASNPTVQLAISGVGALSEWYSWIVLKCDGPTSDDVPVAWADYPSAASTWKLLEIAAPGSLYYRLNCACLAFYSSNIGPIVAGDLRAILVEGGPTYLNITSDDGQASNHVLSGSGDVTGSRSDHNIRLFNRGDNIGLFDGHIGEFGVVSGALSPLNKAKLWAYLAAEWGTV